MCDCIDKLEEKTREMHGDPGGYLDATLGLISGPSVPIIRYYTRTRLKNGNLSKGTKSIGVLASYCPFCGKEYEQ